MSAQTKPPYVTGVLLILIGLGLFAGGAYLIALGGSLYYAITGAVVAVAGVLYFRGNLWGERLYALMLLGTLGWGISEGGSNPWALNARLLAPAILGLWLATPWVRRGLQGGARRNEVGISAFIGLAVLVAFFIKFSTYEAPAEQAQLAPSETSADANGDWVSYGNTNHGQRYSGLNQITPENVGQLEVAWMHRSGDVTAKNLGEATPLKVGNLLYTCSPQFVVMAIDAKTGEERWRSDPKGDTSKFPLVTCRGVAYHKQPNAEGVCAARILAASPQANLRAMDALDGTPCPGFGGNGSISLLKDMGSDDASQYVSTSAPIVAGDLILTSANVSDNLSIDMPSGVIRAFDVITGQVRWAWDMGALDRNGPPPEGDIYTRGTANAWPSFAADEALGMVYVPLGNPAIDFLGSHRPDYLDEYGSALVALDLATGKLRWSRKTMHHDLWDYDLPAQPVLVDLPTADGVKPAIVQATKRADIFVLDRRDGTPIVPIKEVPVPPGGMEGEKMSKTQPLSELSLIPPPLTESQMWGVTPFDQLACRIKFRAANYEGIFTPITTKPTIVYPGILGTIDWGGVTVNDKDKILAVNTTAFPWVLYHIPRPKESPDGVVQDSHFAAPQLGTPYALSAAPFLGPLSAPCAEPPWGHMVAIDLKTNKQIWRRPFGTAQDSGPMGLRLGLPILMGMPSFGGSVTTGGGLIFVSGTLDRYLRAFDIRNGKEVWKARLPAGGQATPMTYMEDGKQYVVITAGGHYVVGSVLGDYTVAFALPDAKK